MRKTIITLVVALASLVPVGGSGPMECRLVGKNCRKRGRRLRCQGLPGRPRRRRPVRVHGRQGRHPLGHCRAFPEGSLEMAADLADEPGADQEPAPHLPGRRDQARPRGPEALARELPAAARPARTVPAPAAGPAPRPMANVIEARSRASASSPCSRPFPAFPGTVDRPVPDASPSWSRSAASTSPRRSSPPRKAA